MKFPVFGVVSWLFTFGQCLAGYGSNYGSVATSPYPPAKYRVTSLVAPPMLNPADEDGKYTGLIVDELESFKALGNFDYVLTESPSGTFDGMISEIINGEADIAAGNVVQTQDLTTKVDFTEYVFGNIIRLAINKDFNATTAKYYAIDSPLVQAKIQKDVTNPVLALIRKSIQDGGAYSILSSYEEGVQKVADGGNVAFLAGTPFISIEQQKHQDTVSFYPQDVSYDGFFMAVKLDSPIRRLLNKLILQIQENGQNDIVNQQVPPTCLR